MRLWKVPGEMFGKFDLWKVLGGDLWKVLGEIVPRPLFSFCSPPPLVLDKIGSEIRLGAGAVS